MVIAVVAALILAAMAVLLPKTPSDSSISLRKLPALIKSPALRNIYLVTVIAITGHFTSYSYIEPFLGQAAGLGENMITIVLTLFGIVGLICSFLFSRRYSGRPAGYVMFAVCGLCISMLMLAPAAMTPVTAIMLCVFWAFAINFYNLIFQSEIIRCAPRGTAVAMSIYSGIYNVGIGGGALIGGYVCSGLSVSFVGYVGGAIAFVAAAVSLRYLLPALKAGNPDLMSD